MRSLLPSFAKEENKKAAGGERLAPLTACGGPVRPRAFGHVALTLALSRYRERASWMKPSLRWPHITVD
jgi:hypothetical protein